MSSPAQWEKLGKSWDAFAKEPSGTGPWKLTLFAPRERAEMVPNANYWDKARGAEARQARAAAAAGSQRPRRGAARRSSRLDRGAGARTRSKSLKKAELPDRRQLLSAQLDLAPVARRGSPWNDIRVRKAANLADRPRRHEGAAVRTDDPRGRLLPARPSVVRQAHVQAEVRSG